MLITTTLHRMPNKDGDEFELEEFPSEFDGGEMMVAI